MDQSYLALQQFHFQTDVMLWYLLLLPLLSRLHLIGLHEPVVTNSAEPMASRRWSLVESPELSLVGLAVV